jgi:putative transposase
METYGVGQRKACELVGIARSSFRYCSKKNDGELRQQLVQLAQEKPRYGYRRLLELVQRVGETVNHKRLYRIYRAAGLSIKRRRRKRLVRSGPPTPALITRLNQQWAIDFAHDVLANGGKFRIFSVLEAHARECLGLEVDTSFPSRRVTRILDELIGLYGKPASIRLDNGPEFTSRHFLAWAREREIELLHIEPGKPVQNALVESFHGRLRDECLNVNWFANLLDARRKIGAWRKEYNHERPHSSLEYLTPVEFRTRALACAAAAVKGRSASQTTDSRSAELRELELQLATPLTAGLAPAPG